jgi:nitrite reductase/ring-hydroxylating ferredoxin subunit
VSVSDAAGHRRPSVVVARVGEIVPGCSKKFLLRCEKGELEAFVVNHEGTLHAYVNRCCHVPMTMDWIDNQFLTEDRRYIQCATHGAWYEPDSGECIAGPPVGQFLTRVPLVVRDGDVHAECPEGDD